MTVRLDWRGGTVVKDVHAAELRALDTTAEKMVVRARSSHPGWKTRTGAAEASLSAEKAERKGQGARVRWGSSLARFLFLEIGARGRAGDSTLRRASDVEGGHLGDRIRDELKGKL